MSDYNNTGFVFDPPIIVDTFAGGDYHYDLEENLGAVIPPTLKKYWSEFKPYKLTEEQKRIIESFDNYKVDGISQDKTKSLVLTKTNKK